MSTPRCMRTGVRSARARLQLFSHPCTASSPTSPLHNSPSSALLQKSSPVTLRDLHVAYNRVGLPPPVDAGDSPFQRLREGTYGHKGDLAPCKIPASARYESPAMGSIYKISDNHGGERRSASVRSTVYGIAGVEPGCTKLTTVHQVIHHDSSRRDSPSLSIEEIHRES